MKTKDILTLLEAVWDQVPDYGRQNDDIEKQVGIALGWWTAKQYDADHEEEMRADA